MNAGAAIRAAKKATPEDVEIQIRQETRSRSRRKNLMRNLEVLQGCAETFSLVQIVRQELEDEGKHLIGVPASIGKQWIVLVRLDDGISLDGFDALRVADVTQVNTRFRRSAFYTSGLRTRRARMPALPKLDLGSTQSLLRSAQRWFALLTIDKEKENPGGAA